MLYFKRAITTEAKVIYSIVLKRPQTKLKGHIRITEITFLKKIWPASFLKNHIHPLQFKDRGVGEENKLSGGAIKTSTIALLLVMESKAALLSYVHSIPVDITSRGESSFSPLYV